MKKILILMITVVLILNFAACKKQAENETGETSDNSNINVLEDDFGWDREEVRVSTALNKAREAAAAFENNDYETLLSYVLKTKRSCFENEIFSKNRLEALSPKTHGEEISSSVEESESNYHCSLEYKYIIPDSDGKAAYTIKYIFSLDKEFNLSGVSAEKTPNISNLSGKIQARIMKIDAPCGKMNVAVTRPSNTDKKTPLVIMVGPFTQNPIFYLNGTYDYATFENLALKLAENGIASVRFGSPDDYYKRMTDDQINKSYTDLIYSNVKSVVDFALKTDNYDKQNVYILSLSTGSFPALDALSEYDGIKGVVLLSPRYGSFAKIIYDEKTAMFGENKIEYKEIYSDIINNKMKNDKTSYFNYGKKFWQEINKKSFESQIMPVSKPILILSPETPDTTKNKLNNISPLTKSNIIWHHIKDVNEYLIKTNDKYNIIDDEICDKITDFIKK